MIDSKLQEELRLKYNPDGSDLRNAQLVMLDLLIFLDRICKENKLTYWLDSGTLLGAVRHGGFIPWDDDVDVCMPREDAKKLKKIMGNKVFDGHIVLQNQSTDKNYLNCDWMTLRDLNTEYIQDSNVHKALKYRGFQVDIFEVETGVKDWMKRMSNKINYRLCIGLAKKSSSFLVRTIANINSRLLNSIIIPIFRQFKEQNNIYSYGIGITFHYKFSHEYIYPLGTIAFEGHNFNCPSNVNEYLKIIYNKWNKVPSEKEIKTHNVIFKFLGE